MPGQNAMEVEPVNQKSKDLLDQLQQELDVVATRATSREAALADAVLQNTEQWAGWHAQWLERAKQFAARQQALEAAGARATGLVAEAEAELERTEAAIRTWLATAAELPNAERRLPNAS